MIETATPGISPEPRNRSTGALVLFLLLALLMPVCLLVYHLILWSTEQTAIASGSQAQLEWAGLIGLAVQGIHSDRHHCHSCGVLQQICVSNLFMQDGWQRRFMAFPALLLRLLGPNNDQLGSILQILICVIAAVIVARVRGSKTGPEIR